MMKNVVLLGKRIRKYIVTEIGIKSRCNDRICWKIIEKCIGWELKFIKFWFKGFFLAKGAPNFNNMFSSITEETILN